MAAKLGVIVDEDQIRRPTLYWLPKLHKRPYKSYFIPILLTSFLTVITKHVIEYCTTVYRRYGKNLF